MSNYMLFWMFLVFLLVASFLLEKKYVLMVLLYIEAIVLLFFVMLVCLSWFRGEFLFIGLFMMLIGAVMAALGLVFVTVLSREHNSGLLASWFGLVCY